MSPRDWEERLNDILSCARNVHSFCEGFSLEAFLDDPKTIRAVAFDLVTIGEAVRSIPMDFLDQFPEIPWGKMIGMRNVLIHEYYKLDEEIIWETCQKDIPILIKSLEKISRRGDSSGFER